MGDGIAMSAQICIILHVCAQKDFGLRCSCSSRGADLLWCGFVVVILCCAFVSLLCRVFGFVWEKDLYTLIYHAVNAFPGSRIIALSV